MRIGVAVFEPQRTAHPLFALQRALEAVVEEGYDSAWVPGVFHLDALTSLAAIGARVPEIELGTAVLPTYPRHPAALAQQALTTQLAVDGRLTLGIGTSHKRIIEDIYGYPFDRPARHMQEYLDVLLPLLDGERVEYEGETVTARIGFTVPRRRRVPVLLAAMAPRMLALAGGRADGTILWMTGPATIESYIEPAITAAAAEAGRPAPRIVCELPVCVTTDIEGATGWAFETFAGYEEIPSYRAMLEREGARTAADLAVIGDVDAVEKRLAALAATGVTDFVAVLFGPEDDCLRTRRAVGSLAGRV